MTKEKTQTMADSLSVEQRLSDLSQHVRDFLFALDRGYLDCKDDSAFIDALRVAVAK